MAVSDKPSDDQIPAVFSLEPRVIVKRRLLLYLCRAKMLHQSVNGKIC